MWFNVYKKEIDSITTTFQSHIEIKIKIKLFTSRKLSIISPKAFKNGY